MEECIDTSYKFCFINNISYIKNIFEKFKDSLDSFSKGYIFRNNLANKLFKLGHVLVIKSLENDLIGFAAYYSNDTADKIGFLSLIAIKEEYRGKGYGNILLRKVMDEMKVDGMKYARLEVNRSNFNAYRLYIKEGFVKISEKDEKYMMERKL